MPEKEPVIAAYKKRWQFFGTACDLLHSIICQLSAGIFSFRKKIKRNFVFFFLFGGNFLSVKNFTNGI